MTTSGKMLSQGARHARIFALNTTYGTPLATDTNYYNGVEVETIKGFDLNAVEPRKFTHVGQDRPLGIDYLPANEAMDGVISVGGDEFDVTALVSGVSTTTIGEAKGIHIGTNHLGDEPSVGLMLYQKATDLDLGLTRWRVFISPTAKMFFLPSGMNENATEHKYKVAPGISKQNIWGAPLTEEDDGCLSAQGLFLMTEGKPELVSFLADGVEDEYVFPTARPALSVNKIVVWKNGTLVTSGITKTTTKVTFTAAPAANDRIVVFYEW
jgi:hypothetical protein